MESDPQLPPPSTPGQTRRPWMLMLPAIGWIWLVGLTVLGLAGFEVRRHHFESAGLAFGAGLLFFAALKGFATGAFASAKSELIDGKRGARASMALYVVPMVAASIAYGWTIPLGPLSDDFVLRRWATAGDWTPDEWIHWRPVPLALWQAIGAAGGDWRTLHALNVVFHAINSALVFRIGATWLGPRAGLTAGVVFALFPASVEAVAWTAGVFDVLSTTFVLLAVSTYVSGTGRAGTTLAIVMATIAGLSSKESAVAIPVLLALAGGVAVSKSRHIVRHPVALALAISVALGFVLIRLLVSAEAADHLQQVPAGRREWKDLLVRPLAALAVPVRTETGIGSEAYLGGLIVLMLVGIGLAQMSRVKETAGQRAAGLLIGTIWIVVAALPLLAQFYVSPALEGSRYLYLPSVGFAIVIASGFTGARWNRWDLLSTGLLLCLLTLYASRLTDERLVWLEAARLRDRLLTNASEAVRSTPCRTLTVVSAPDSFRGVYVFRNGLPEALAALPMKPDGSACQMQWNGTALVPLGPS
jgi:hypothetical protein